MTPLLPLLLSLSALTGCADEETLSCEDYFIETYSLDTVDYYSCSLSHLDCEATPLDRSASVRTAAGHYQSTFSPDQSVEVVATLANNTDEVVNYTSYGCLVSGIHIDGGEIGASISADCFTSIEWTLEPGEAINAAVEGFTASDFGIGTNRAQLTFSSSDGGTCCPCTQWEVE